MAEWVVSFSKKGRTIPSVWKGFVELEHIFDLRMKNN